MYTDTLAQVIERRWDWEFEQILKQQEDVTEETKTNFSNEKIECFCMEQSIERE